MPPQRTADRTRPRQDPVSCQLCRSKKLKCDRQRPCANCNSRGVHCEYQGEAPVSAPAPAPADPLSHDEDLRAENKAIRARLQQLEHAVFGAKAVLNPSVSSSHHSSPFQTVNSAYRDVESDKEYSDMHKLASLETSELNELPDYADSFDISLHDADQTLRFSKEQSTKRPMSLPTQETAMRLFDIYAEKLDSVQHLMHAPTVRAMFANLYAQLGAGHSVHPGSLALLLAICANAALYWTQEAYQGSVFANDQIASKVAHVWIGESLKALEQVRVSSAPTLESVQGAILASFLLYHTEGFSARSRLLQESVHAMARDLGMHKIDAPGVRPPLRTQDDIVLREVERKVWWHLACTNWLLGYVGGPQEGVYSLNPRHMRVNVPRNLNHDDLSTQGPDFTRSLAEPTVMSYYLHRIKLSTICREVIDELWEGPVFQPELVAYDRLIMVDSRFDAFLDDLPPFLRLDKTLPQLEREYQGFDMPLLLLQRIIVNLMLNSHRCKLHMRFLIRYKSDERFGYSRSKALQSARAVLKTRSAFQEAKNILFTAHLRNGGIAQHFFYATMVLVMDLCINNPEDAGRKAEIKEGLAIMEESTASSRIAKQFLDSLTDLLQKHKVKLPGTAAKSQSTGTHATLPNDGNEPDVVPANGFAHVEAGLPMLGQYDDALDSSMQFDSVWQDFVQHGSYLDYQDWDTLMNDLEMRVM